MFVGFEHIIVFNKDGKVSNFQKSYNNNHAKIVKVFFPLNSIVSANKGVVTLETKINDTFPQQIIKTVGVQQESDANCYVFDISDIYNTYKQEDRIGLSRVFFKPYYILNDCNFVSESFRV